MNERGRAVNAGFAVRLWCVAVLAHGIAGAFQELPKLRDAVSTRLAPVRDAATDCRKARPGEFGDGWCQDEGTWKRQSQTLLHTLDAIEALPEALTNVSPDELAAAAKAVDSAAAISRGVLQRELRRLGRAIQEQQSINAEALSNLRRGDELMREGRYKEAAAYFDRAEKLANAYPQYRSRARIRRAEADLRRDRVVPPDEVLEAESRADWTGAWRKLGLDGQATPHGKVLNQFIVLHESIEDSQKRNELQALVDQYRTLLKQPNPLEDRHIVAAARHDLVKIEAALRAAAEQEATDRQAVVDRLARSHQFDKAIQEIDKLITDLKGSVSQQTLDKLRSRRATLAKQAAEEPTWEGTFNRVVRDLIRIVLDWTPLVLLAVLLLAAVRVWRVRLAKPRDELFISLTDKTTQSGSTSTLDQEFQSLLDAPIPGASDSAKPDITSDIDGSPLGNLRLGVTAEDLKSLVQQGLAISVGVIQVNVVQLFALAQRLFRRPYRRSLVGVLFNTGTQVTFRAMELDARGNVIRKWLTTQNTRQEALVEIAMRVLVSLDEKKQLLSTDWRSLRHTRRGMESLRESAIVDKRREMLERAREEFQEAVRHDADNWVARFYLASTQRKTGLNEVAAMNFSTLMEAWLADEKFRESVRAVQKDFIYIVAFNLAAALHKTKNPEAMQEAEDILSELAL